MSDWSTAEAGYSSELMARAGAAPAPSFGDIWRANWSASGLDTLTGSGQPLEDSFNDLVDKASARLGPIPAAAQNAGLDWVGAHGFDAKAAIVGQLVAGLPDDQRKELEPLVDFRARAADNAAAIERNASDVNGRTYGLSGHATAWLAGVSRQMVDPVNAAALLIPVGGESGLLMSAAKGALTAAAVQGAQEPLIQQQRARLGLEAGVDRAAGDVAQVAGGAFAMGVGLPLLFRGAGWIARKAFGRPDVAVPTPSAEPQPLLALPHPDQFAPTIVTPNYYAPKLLPPPEIAPEIWDAGRALMGRLEGEQGEALPVVDMHQVRLTSEEAALRERDQLLASNQVDVPAGAQDVADQLARVTQIEQEAATATGAARRTLLERRDELLADTTPEALRAQAAPLEQQRVNSAERAAIADRLNAIAEERTRAQAQRLTPPAMIGQRMPVRRNPDIFQLVAPGDLNAAAMLADRDVVIGPHEPVDAAAARAEAGEPLPPRVIAPGAPFPAPRSTTRFAPETPAPAAAAEAPKPAPAAVATGSKARGPAARPEETRSLFEFLASKGGLAPHPDLEAVLGNNPFVPGFGRLVRKTGMKLDRAREAATSAGYLEGEATGGDSTRPNDLLEAIDQESRGQRRYRLDRMPTARAGEASAAAERQQADIERHFDGELEDAGIPPADVDPAVRDRALEIMQREGINDALVAFERAVMENSEREAPDVRRDEISEIPGWDAADEPRAPAAGARDVEGGQAAPGAEPSAGREADRGAPGEGSEAGPRLGNPQLAEDAHRALDDAGGDFHITIEDPDTGGVRQVSARDALREAEEDAAAARELKECIAGGAGGALEEEE